MSPPSLMPPLGAGDHVDGPADGELELVMYGDFQCPYCIAAHPIVSRVRERLAGRLRFAFRHFPLRDAHPDAQLAAEASEAADAQGKFWEMYELLYESRGRLGRALLEEYAARLGLEPAAFSDALETGAHAERVARDLAGGTENGITGTPAFFVNGRRHDGSFDAGSLLGALDAAA